MTHYKELCAQTSLAYILEDDSGRGLYREYCLSAECEDYPRFFFPHFVIHTIRFVCCLLFCFVFFTNTETYFLCTKDDIFISFCCGIRWGFAAQSCLSAGSAHNDDVLHWQGN